MRKSSISLVIVAIVMAMIVIPAHLLCAQDTSTLRTSRVLAPINEQQLVTLGGHLVPWARSENDLGAAPDSMQVQSMHLMLKRSDSQESALQKLLAEQQNPKSANYHKWLTPEEYGTQYGVSDADLAKVASWLTSHGFTVEKVAKGNNAIRLSGTAGQVKEAFHTTLHQYRVGSETHFANATNPMIPAALAPVIAGIQGMNDMKPKPLHTTPGIATLTKGAKGWAVKDVKPAESAAGAKPEFEFNDGTQNWHLVSPGDFATIYGVAPVWNTYDGTGQTIAIVSESDINPKDIDSFRANFALPATKLNIIYEGPNPGMNGGEGEADLDVEWSGAIARNATIDLVVSSNVTDSIFYIIDNSLAPVMSVSFGECELGLGGAGNTFFEELYKQGASQGITELVAAGDSGSDSCDQDGQSSFYGLSVSGWASTPYNVAVGGTDFPVNILGTASNYWNTTNDANDMHSAKSYVPEAPWNNSCASPEVLALAQLMAQKDPTDFSAWASDTTNEALCNDTNPAGPGGQYSAQSYFLNVVGGGGGVSNCTISSNQDPTTCAGGYAQPAWQSGVPGVPSDSKRHLPDVSFFSGNGAFASGLVFCESDVTPDGTCNINNGDVMYNIAGGTSFASPAFAGIVALLNQKTGSSLGNINYTLYQLAGSQFTDPTKSNSCQSDAITGTDTCIFHDVTKGGNAVPCWVGPGSVDNPPNGLCTPTISSDQYGVLSGYSSGVGYDSASGLGSINAYNLINNWPGSQAAAQTTLTLTSGANPTYGVGIGGTVTVTGASGTPTGLVTLMYRGSNGTPESAMNASDLTSGSATVTASPIIPPGTYKVFARYSGDATYAASASADQSVTIAPAATSLVLNASRTSVGENQSTQLAVTLQAPSFGNSPTGNVVFTNTTTGAVIGVIPVSGYTDSSTGYSYARAIVSAGAGALVTGPNQITATYAGDTNYSTASASAPAVQYTGGFSIAASSSTLTLSPGATSGNAVVFTLTPSSGGTISASSIKLSCPGTLPAGVACQFSAPAAGANGTVSSTLTLVLNSPLAQSSPQIEIHRWFAPYYLAMLLMGGVFVAVPRKRSAMITIALILTLAAVFFSFGCGSSSKSSTAPATPTVTTTLTASSATPALNSPVILKATLSNSAATGTVSFFDGTNLLGSAAVSNGAASLTTSSLPVGTGTLTATYSGDSTYPAATSAAVSVDVTFTSTITVQAVDNTTGNIAQQNVNLTVK